MLLLFVGERPSLLVSAKKLIFTCHMNVYKNLFPNSFLPPPTSPSYGLKIDGSFTSECKYQKVREDCYIKDLNICLSSLSRLVYVAL